MRDDAEVDQLAHAVLDVQPQAAERLHQRLDVERLVGARIQVAQDAGAQRRLHQRAKPRIEVRAVGRAVAAARGAPGAEGQIVHLVFAIYRPDCVSKSVGRPDPGSTMLSCRHQEIAACRTARPVRPGSPARFLSGKPIRYYRPKGSAEVRPPHRRRVSGVQCRPALGGVPDLRGQDAGARERHDDRADDRRRHDAGRARRLRDRDDGPRAGRFRHFDRREPVSRPALRAELHAPARLAVPERCRAVRRRASSASTTCCFRRRCCSKPTPTSAISSCAPA